MARIIKWIITIDNQLVKKGVIVHPFYDWLVV